MLERILAPEDLRQLTLQELTQLASEIRSRIVNVLAINGGHLASNLGSVEMLLALHAVFESPKDSFIFDVSHQIYTHKLVTGRNDERFDLIRKSKGLSGFAHPKESAHDAFFAGHAGTALSLALGRAKARDLTKEECHIIPVIGDATLTCGLALEALNNMPRTLGRFIVILNDNAMSISRNVGSVTHILSRLLNNPRASKWVFELEKRVAKIPGCGPLLAKQGHLFSESVKNLVSSAPFFDHFGLSYIGPIDGHDMKKMITIFEEVKNLEMPVLIHLFTKKGQGIEKAEKDPITYHGVKPFDPKTCEFYPTASPKPTFSKIFGQHLVKMGQRDPHLVAITPATSVGSCLDPFLDRFPERGIDVGIAEGHAVTYAGGLAIQRTCRVICAIYSTFLQRALDNLFQDVCLQESPVVFAIDRAGLAPADGATHHGIYDMSFLKVMPNMVICQPRNGDVLVELLNSAFSWDRPTAIRYPNMTTEVKKESHGTRPLGRGEVLAEGSELLIIGLGVLCDTALKVRTLLLERGIEATVVDPIFVKPLDTELLGRLLLNHRYVITLEEHSLKGGLGSEINSFILGQDFNEVRVLNFGISETFLDHGSYEELLTRLQLTPELIVQRAAVHFGLTKEKALR